MKKILFICLVCISTGIISQNKIEMSLWPNGTPNDNGIPKDDSHSDIMNNPSLTVYPAMNPNGKAIIMCPGGAYGWLAMDHEGHAMADWMNGLGITYVVLKYRMPVGNHEIPLSDAEQAMRLVREHATEWSINPKKIGIMGASAGGHLASTLATHYSSKETRPDFQILFYPVITMDDSYTHGGSKANLLGENPSKELVEKYSNELQVTADTPKAFILLSSDDEAVPAVNGVTYYMALVHNKVSASLHAYPVGGHGWGYGDGFIYKRQWTEELEKWLREEVK